MTDELARRGRTVDAVKDAVSSSQLSTAIVVNQGGDALMKKKKKTNNFRFGVAELGRISPLNEAAV